MRDYEFAPLSLVWVRTNANNILSGFTGF